MHGLSHFLTGTDRIKKVKRENMSEKFNLIFECIEQIHIKNVKNINFEISAENVVTEKSILFS